MPVIVHAPRTDVPPAGLMARWRPVPVAVIADVSGGTCQIDPAIRPLNPPGRQPRLYGRAVTAWCEPPDFGAVLYAIDLVAKGDVLVIAAAGDAATAMIGEILGGQLRRLGAAGIICDGAVRDVSELSSFGDLPVFTRHVTPRGPSSWDKGVVNGSVRFGGRSISPGDLVIGDDDGLSSLTASDMATYIDAAEKKLALEAEWQKSLGGGRTVAETFSLPPMSRRV